MFAKRHYERVAEAIQEAKRVVAGSDASAEAIEIAQTGIEAVVIELSFVFKGDNSNFSRDRFVRACVPGNNVRARS